MGAIIKYDCDKCGFSYQQHQGSGRARPTESFNSDYIEYTCRSCKTVGRQISIHPVGRLRLDDKNTYFIRIYIDLIKTEPFKNSWLQKLLRGFRWVPVAPEDSLFMGRVYEEKFLDKMDSYLSVQHRVEFRDVSLLKSREQLWNAYSKLVKAKTSIRESTLPERLRKDNQFPSHEFVFELMTDDRGNLICCDDPGHCCPKCHSTDFRYGSSYCPVCDNQLTEEAIGHWD